MLNVTLQEYLLITELSEQRFISAYAEIRNKQFKFLDITGPHLSIVIQKSVYGKGKKQVLHSSGDI